MNFGHLQCGRRAGKAFFSRLFVLLLVVAVSLSGWGALTLRGAAAQLEDTGYYYEKLSSGMEQDFYEWLSKVVKPGQALDNTYSLDVENVADPNALSTQLLTSARTAMGAWRYDHPEVYWLGTKASFSSSAQKSGNTYTFFITVKCAAIAGDEGIDSFINDLVSKAGSGSDYDKIKAIHDALANSVDYVDNGSASSHQINGALKNGQAVCEGYAKAFKAACDELGIECILATGSIAKDGGQEKHMWNMVKLDGKWYAVDVTNDDQDSLLDDLFLVGSNSELGLLGNSKYSSVYALDGGGDGLNFSLPGLSDEKYRPQAVTYKVNFDSCGGSAVETVYLNAAGLITEPAAPVRNGYVFGGWFTDNSYSTRWNFGSDIVSSSMMLYAKWIESNAETCTVTFVINSDVIVSAITVEKGKTFVAPIPSRSGYTFNGWFRDKALTSRWDDSQIVGESMTLYAGWSPITSSIPGDYVVIPGGSVVLPGNSGNIIGGGYINPGNSGGIIGGGYVNPGNSGNIVGGGYVYPSNNYYGSGGSYMYPSNNYYGGSSDYVYPSNNYYGSGGSYMYPSNYYYGGSSDYVYPSNNYYGSGSGYLYPSNNYYGGSSDYVYPSNNYYGSGSGYLYPSNNYYGGSSDYVYPSNNYYGGSSYLYPADNYGNGYVLLGDNLIENADDNVEDEVE